MVRVSHFQRAEWKQKSLDCAEIQLTLCYCWSWPGRAWNIWVVQHKTRFVCQGVWECCQTGFLLVKPTTITHTETYTGTERLRWEQNLHLAPQNLNFRQKKAGGSSNGSFLSPISHFLTHARSKNETDWCKLDNILTNVIGIKDIISPMREESKEKYLKVTEKKPVQVAAMPPWWLTVVRFWRQVRKMQRWLTSGSSGEASSKLRKKNTAMNLLKT